MDANNNFLMLSPYMLARLEEKAAENGVTKEEEAEAVLFLALDSYNAAEIQSALLKNYNNLIEYEYKHEQSGQSEKTESASADTMTGGDKYRTIKEQAERAGLSYWHIREAALAGELQHIRSGAKILIRDSALSEYLRKKESEDR